MDSSIKKIAIIGPECTGKSSLSEMLAKHFNTTWVPEYARSYIENLRGPYQQSDLLKIAHGQLRVEDEWAKDANKVLICDTNLYVIKIWSEVKFGSVDPEIINHIQSRKYDLYLLTYVDIPWEDDPQREHPDKREYLYSLYYNELKQQQVPFVEIKGSFEQRRKNAIQAIEKMLVR
ncbi:AAA family ATPase [Chryseosolibacter indicus]|uniref:AAA family ATPase n=1 Tax=Chryseosolibacter indicus TaxID=2782351 RepID=UPI0020B423B7|nr:ATP-binding protein [Chryseosolibacter indicus]